MVFYPFHEFWPLYLGFLGFVLVLLALDLGLTRKSTVMSFQRAALTTGMWVAVALLVNVGFYLFFRHDLSARAAGLGLTEGAVFLDARRLGIEFLTGYITELALSVDNLFVFIIIFSYFRVPESLQRKILVYGILGAIFFRALFISVGTVLFHFQVVVYLFAGILFITGLKLLFNKEEDEADLDKNWMIQKLRRVLPVTPHFEGDRFFIRKDGQLLVTPLFVCLLAVEFTDVLFAFDSVPAVLALTREPLVAFASNILATLGLRSLYFLVAALLSRLRFLKYALALILMFVAIKMAVLPHFFPNHSFPIGASLAIIVGTLAIFTIASLAIPEKKSKTSSTGK